MKKTAIFLTALGLSACAHSPRYVRIHCVSPDQVTQLESQRPGKVKDRLSGKADEDVKIVTGQLIRMESFADGLMGVIRGCQGSDRAS